MKIWYTNELIFWNNETSDFLEKDVFDNYLSQDKWVELRNVKSINWENHYNASFYATDNFNATYFKIQKNGHLYYFFIDDILFDSNNGKQYSLKLDIYNTYSIQLIERLKQENPNVYFTRKHTDRFVNNDFNNPQLDYLNHPYVFNLPKYLSDVDTSIRLADTSDIQVPNDLLEIENRKKDMYNPSITYRYKNKDFTDDGGKTFKYLRINQNIGNVKGDMWYANSTPSCFIYIPFSTNKDAYVHVNDELKHFQNKYNNILKFAQSLAVDIITLPIAPSNFTHMFSLKELYNNETWYTDMCDDYKGHIMAFVNRYSGDLVQQDIINIPLFNNIDKDPNYSWRDNILDPIFLSPQCSYFKINTQKIDYPYLFTSLNTSNNNIASYGVNNLRMYLYSECYLSLKTNNNDKIYDKEFETETSFGMDLKIPFLGNVYSEYLKNNGTSMRTELTLANEYKTMQDRHASTKGWTNAIGGVLSIAGGAASMALSGGMIGAGDIAGGLTDVINAGVDTAQSHEINAFNLKKVVATQDALKQDLKNRVGDLKDPYGKGQIVEIWKVLRYELPTIEKKRVFSDIYFNGYIINSFDKFNTYNNRKSFNYFELKNVFALCGMYLKLPKSIQGTITKQLETGVRLWKTPKFDYTMGVDNRELKYV